jgi:hypothetical protein
VPYQWVYCIVGLLGHIMASVSILQFLTRKNATRTALRGFSDGPGLGGENVGGGNGNGGGAGNGGGGNGHGGGGGAVGESHLDRGMVSPMRALFGKRWGGKISELHTSFRQTVVSRWSSRYSEPSPNLIKSARFHTGDLTASPSGPPAPEKVPDF